MSSIKLKFLNIVYLSLRTLVFAAIAFLSFVAFLYACRPISEMVRPVPPTSSYSRSMDAFMVLCVCGCGLGLYYYERKFFIWLSDYLASRFSFADTDRVWKKVSDEE